MAGAEQSLLLLVQHLRHQYTLLVACPKPSPLADRLDKMGVTTLKLPDYSCRKLLSLNGLCSIIHTSLVLLKMILTYQPDLIHANTFSALICTALPARLTSKPLISHARDFHRQHHLIPLASMSCTKIIAVSQSIKNHLISHGVNGEKITVIYNGVLPPKKIHLNPSKPLTYAHIGQCVPWKNHTLFLQAAAQIYQKHPQSRFLLVGDDLWGREREYKKSIQNLIKKLHLTNAVEWLNWQADMAPIWSRVSCLVHTAAAEPFGRVVLESLAHRVPVIAVNRCGPGEILQHDSTALLVEPDDVDQLVITMEKRVSHCDPLDPAVADWVSRMFSAEKTASQVAQLYQKLLKGSGYACRHHLSYV